MPFITAHDKSTYLSSISKNRPWMSCSRLDCALQKALQKAALIEVILWKKKKRYLSVALNKVNENFRTKCVSVLL